jgi:hypothetical protein
MLSLKKITAALAITALSSLASAQTFVVKADDNSTSGGVGMSTVFLNAGQSFSVSVGASDLWNAGALPRWSNADGLTGSLLYGSGTDAEVPVYANGTQIGGNFGAWSQNGLTAAYGTLVGQFGSGAFFSIGTSYAGIASASDTLKLFYFDSNNGDNTGSVMATISTVSAVPEPESFALLLVGLGLVGSIVRRRKSN